MQCDTLHRAKIRIHSKTPAALPLRRLAWRLAGFAFYPDLGRRHFGCGIIKFNKLHSICIHSNMNGNEYGKNTECCIRLVNFVRVNHNHTVHWNGWLENNRAHWKEQQGCTQSNWKVWLRNFLCMLWHGPQNSTIPIFAIITMPPMLGREGRMERTHLHEKYASRLVCWSKRAHTYKNQDNYKC